MIYNIQPQHNQLSLMEELGRLRDLKRRYDYVDKNQRNRNKKRNMISAKPMLLN